VRTPRFVDLTERMIYLRSIPVAAMLPPPVLKIIASQLRERSFAPGTLLMKEGAPIEALHLLTEGKVSLVRKGTPVGALTPPQSLGFLGILARSAGNYTAAAEVPVRTLELATETLIELLEDHVDFLQATVRYLGEGLLYEIQELPAQAMSSRLDGVDEKLPEGRELDLVEKIVWVRSLSAFKRTNLNALAAMARQMTEIHVPAGGRIWSMGEEADFSLFMLAGRGRCRAADGRVWHAGPTSVNGGLEAIANKPRWYELTAEKPVVALKSPSSAFLDMLEDDFSLAGDFIARIASDLVGLLEKKAAEGKSSAGVLRNLHSPGAVPVGA
jgi:CRP-like cAMP-binding protein